MTELSGSFNAQAAETIPRSPAIPTLIMILGLAVTWAALPSTDAESIFDTAAIGVGIALAGATAVEAFSGVRALIRTDNLMLWVLYGLTFLEFLFPQPDVNSSVSVDAATNGTGAVLLGFFGMVVGRHLIPDAIEFHRAGRFQARPSIRIVSLCFCRRIPAHLHRSEFQPDRNDRADGKTEVLPVLGEGETWRYIRVAL